MCPAIVSGMVTGDALVRYWSIISFVPSHTLRSLGKKLTRAGPLSFLKWRMRDTAVTVIWASPRFGHHHSQTQVILASPVTLTLTQITKGMAISLGFWEWRCPKRGDSNITVTPPSQVKTGKMKYMHNKAK